MAVGFIVSILAIRFIESNRLHLDQVVYPVINAPAVTFAVLSIPIFDMTRVFVLRLLKGRSPFSADRSHFHHYFVDNGISHAKTNCILFAANVSCVLIALSLRPYRSAYVILVLYAYLTALCYLALYLLKRRRWITATAQRSRHEHDPVYRSENALPRN